MPLVYTFTIYGYFRPGSQVQRSNSQLICESVRQVMMSHCLRYHSTHAFHTCDVCLCMYWICMYVFMCVYICMYVCVCEHMYLCMYVFMCLCTYVCMYVQYVFIDVFYVHMAICIHVFMYVCMYV